MSFIGNKPDSYGYSTTSYENFNGDGVTTTFTLSKTVTSSSDIQVVVNNVIQEPEVAYYVTNLTSLVFTSAPSVGTDNIYIVYRNFINTRFALEIPDNTISSQKILPNSIVNSSLSNSSITINGTEISLGSSGSITAGATITDDTSTNATRYIMLGSETSGAYTSANVSSTKLTFNPNTGTLSANVFSGAGSSLTNIPNSSLSNSSITINGSSVSLGGSATISAGATITDDTSTNATRYIMLGSATSGAYTAANVSSTKLTFNPSTGTLSATALTETSSITLKENINPIENALPNILQLNGVVYDRKDGSHKNEAGLIAEDVYKVIPNIVSKDENGNPIGIHYTKLTAYLIEAIKTLKEEIEELKNR
jgi:hypothetical protein